MITVHTGKGTGNEMRRRSKRRQPYWSSVAAVVRSPLVLCSLQFYISTVTTYVYLGSITIVMSRCKQGTRSSISWYNIGRVRTFSLLYLSLKIFTIPSKIGLRFCLMDGDRFGSVKVVIQMKSQLGRYSDGTVSQ